MSSKYTSTLKRGYNHQHSRQVSTLISLYSHTFTDYLSASSNQGREPQNRLLLQMYTFKVSALCVQRLQPSELEGEAQSITFKYLYLTTYRYPQPSR